VKIAVLCGNLSDKLTEFHFSWKLSESNGFQIFYICDHDEFAFRKIILIFLLQRLEWALQDLVCHFFFLVCYFFLIKGCWP